MHFVRAIRAQNTCTSFSSGFSIQLRVWYCLNLGFLEGEAIAPQCLCLATLCLSNMRGLGSGVVDWTVDETHTETQIVFILCLKKAL